MSVQSTIPGADDLAAQENLLARLDRLPVNRRILFLVGLLGVVWILEAFDIGIIAPVLFILKGEWQLSPNATGLVGSAGTLGIVLGLLPAGRAGRPLRPENDAGRWHRRLQHRDFSCQLRQGR
jgi:hypothetical protein